MTSTIFSRQCEYALQAVVYLAKKKDGKMTTIRELANDLGIPYHFLGKTLQRLAGQGMLTSSRGRTGGYALNRKAKNATLFHIVSMIDGTEFTDKCVLGFAACSGKEPCAVHNQWAAIRQVFYDMLAGRTVSQIVEQPREQQPAKKKPAKFFTPISD